MSTDDGYKQLDESRLALNERIDKNQARYVELTSEIERTRAAHDHLGGRRFHEERKQVNIDTFRASDARETVMHEMIERFGDDEQRQGLRAVESSQRADGSGVPRLPDHTKKTQPAEG